MGNRVLVTGGAGFIGSNLTRALVEAGHGVAVLDNLSSGRRQNLNGLGVEFIEGDIRAMDMVQGAVRGSQWVFHLAAMVSVAESMSDPLGCYRTNLEGSLNVLQAARLEGVERVVLSSSCAVYGDQGGAVSEAAPTDPLSPYAASKLAMESAAYLYKRAYGLSTISLRYFNVYGPGQSRQSDYAAVIPIFIGKFIASDPIVIDGDGKQTRDFVFVEDVVRANLLAAEAESASDEPVNIGSGRVVSILDLVELLQRFFSESASVEHGPRRAGDIRSSLADVDKAEEALGYRAAIDLQAGLKATVEWFRSRERSEN